SPPLTFLGFNIGGIQLASGQILFQYRPNDDSTDDFALVSSSLWSQPITFKVDFAGNFTMINSVFTSSFLQGMLSSNSTPTFHIANNGDLQTFLFAANGLV